MSTHSDILHHAAADYLDAGLCVLPARRTEKRPAVGSWKRYQSTLPTPAELSAWMAGGPDAICILCGAVSSNLEMIDFDAGGERFAAWWDRIPPPLRERLVIEKTPAHGRHVSYLVEKPICGNLKLAQRRDGEKVTTLIETRGEGGLFLCAPTPGYELVQGDFRNLPRLNEAEREILLQAAWELNEHQPPGVNGPSRPGILSTACDRPGDDFNQRGDVRAVLEQHGWTRVSRGENEYWRRPGKKSGWSATLKDRAFYVFSSNAAPFEANRAYSPFAVYTLLNHGGDFERAARAMREDGYGSDAPSDNKDGLDISMISNQPAKAPAEPPVSEGNGINPEPPIQTLRKLIDDFTGLNPPIIHGLLREGETMNVIASPKMGKSWLVSTLAISVASGLDWLGLPVEQGRVLHIDNELHTCTSSYRYDVISEAMRLPHHLYSGNIDLVSLRGHLRDLYAMGEWFIRLESGRYKLIIIDAFYRTLPRDTDENDNGAIANLYNCVDHYAARLGCAFVLIHHTSKGNQSGKSVTDVGAGAGSQSRAADTHLVLRPHEEEGIVVLESAVRSWPPMAPRALLWRWPLFVPTEDVDPSALQGAIKPKPKLRETSLDEFVEACIAINDPCSKRSVGYEAGQRLGLSERQAYDMLDLTMERGLVARIRTGAQMRYVKSRPGVSGDKALWTAALLAHAPEENTQDIADAVGVSRQYVNQIRRSVFGNSLETAGN